MYIYTHRYVYTYTLLDNNARGEQNKYTHRTRWPRRNVFKSVVFPGVNSRSDRRKLKCFYTLLLRPGGPTVSQRRYRFSKELRRTWRRFVRGGGGASVPHRGYCCPPENTECQYTFYCVYTTPHPPPTTPPVTPKPKATAGVVHREDFIKTIFS